MITYDVRLLVRGDHTAEEVLEQLLTGVLRVHATVELVTLATSVDGTSVVRPAPTAHRSGSSAAHYAVVRDWTGEVLA